MKNPFEGRPAHSAEYFGDTRDAWWNGDYLEMVASEWKLERIRTVLDVGSGIGHWGRALATVFPAETHLIGIDQEPRWVEEATRRAAGAGLSGRFTYRIGSAESLQFDDEAFDLVTCQTLLMHVADPAAVLGEMVRVTRRSGLVIVAEPTNVAGLLGDSIALGDAPETTATLVQFQLVCERGKKALGEGNDLIGESLPRLLVESGLERVRIRQNDRAWPMVPPYDSPVERLQMEEVLDAVDREIWIWDEPTTRRYFRAGGGSAEAFLSNWTSAIAQRRRVAEGLRASTFSCAGAGLFYLAWGWRKTRAVDGA